MSDKADENSKLNDKSLTQGMSSEALGNSLVSANKQPHKVFSQKLEPDERPDYQWPPSRDTNLSYQKKSRNPVHSIITALPLLMLVAGLYIYFRGEAEQMQGAPIKAESVDVSGIFTGLSHTSDRHYLWLDVEGAAKGVRIKKEQVVLLEALARDEKIMIKTAPSVHESKTHWVWYAEQSGEVFIDAGDSLR